MTSQNKPKGGAVTAPPFWKTKSFDDFSPAEWESLCDSCGWCCVIRFQDADTDEIYLTDLVCRLSENRTCRCTAYPRRHELEPNCIQLTPDLARKLTWLPETCAYRRLATGGDLPAWHYLVCGDPKAVHRAGASIRGKVVSAEDLSDEEMAEHIIDGDD
jgi:uncharacterized cysteine cluster protein YcgN (CxxCxxCC family)